MADPHPEISSGRVLGKKGSDASLIVLYQNGAYIETEGVRITLSQLGAYIETEYGIVEAKKKRAYAFII